MNPLSLCVLSLVLLGAQPSSNPPPPRTGETEEAEQDCPGKHKECGDTLHPPPPNTTTPLGDSEASSLPVEEQPDFITLPKQDGSYGPNHPSPNEDPFWLREWLLVIFTMALVLITGGLAYFTKRLWRTAWHHNRIASRHMRLFSQQNRLLKRQHELNERIFYAEHRPRLRVRSFVVPRLGEVNRITPMDVLEELFQEEFSASFNIVNIGGTAARIVKDYFTLQIRHFEFARVPWERTTTKTRAEIPVGGSCKIRSPSWEFTKDEFIYMMDKTLSICLIGEVRYHDKIGNEHTTTFYRRFNFDAKRFDPIQAGDYEHED